MSDPLINWKSFDLHIENFLPGIILASEMVRIAPSVKNVFPDMSNSIINATLAVALFYAIGLLNALTARFVIDSISERWVRGLVFDKLVHGDRSNLAQRLKEKDSDFRADLNCEINEHNRRQRTAEWNAIYRWALRSVDFNKKEEVVRRRAQGRLVRGLVFPGMLAVFILSDILFSKLGYAWSTALPYVASVLSLAYGITAYAYAELMNMAEAYDITLLSKFGSKT